MSTGMGAAPRLAPAAVTIPHRQPPGCLLMAATGDQNQAGQGALAHEKSPSRTNDCFFILENPGI